MYGVKCPKCNRLLKLAVPVDHAKLKCRGCGAVFVGSTEVLKDPADRPDRPDRPARPARPADHGPPAAPYRRRPATKPRSLVVPIVVVAVTALAVVFGSYAIWFYATHPYYEFRNEYGEVELRGRFTPEEGERLKKKFRAKARRARSEGTVPRPGDGTPSPTQPARPRRPKVFVPQADRNVVVAPDWQQGQRTPLGKGTVRGLVTNKYGETVTSLRVSVVFYESGGEAILIRHRAVQVLPPGVPIPFSVRYRKPAEPIERVEGLASKVQRDPGVLSCEVPSTDVSGAPEAAGTVVTLKGVTRNRTGAAMRDPKVYCDFFNARGEYVDSASGTLERDDGHRATSLRAGEKAKFLIQLNAADKTYLVDEITACNVRLFGRRL